MGNCKIIAIANQKGGVGKTTTTLNLGVALAKTGKRVLLVDGDPQGSLTLSMGIKEPDELPVSLATVMEAVIEDAPAPKGMGILHHEEGVDLIPANIELSGLEMSLFNTMSRESILKTCLSPVRRDYDYILIDCMPSLGMMTINALTAADSVIVPCKPDYLSTKGMNLLMKSISRIRRKLNPRLQMDGILFTMVDSRTSSARDIINTLRDGIGTQCRIFETEIPRSIRAAESSLNGVSIFSYDRKGKVAAAYENLAKEVICIGERTQDRSRDDGLR